MSRVLLGSILLGLGALAPSLPQANHPRRVTVEIRGMAFIPESLVVARGDTIVWVNHDIVPHTVEAVSGGSWKSPILNQGDTFLLVKSEAKIERYRCGLHPTMEGRLTLR